MRLAMLCCASIVSMTGALTGQVTVPGSDKETIAILGGGPSLNLDVTQAKLGLTLVKEFVCMGTSGPAAERCRSDVNRNHLDLAVRFAAAAQDGKRTLFAGGDITPGLEIATSIAKFWERPTGGYDALYLPVVAKLAQTKTAEFQNAIASLADRTTKSLGIGIGFIHAFTESRAIGVSVGVQRIGDSPGLRSAEQICTTTNIGIDTKGKSYSSSKCEARIVGALVTETVLQPRLEGLIHFPNTEHKPSFGIVTSVSGTRRTGTSMSYSAALGPTLHPAGRPREVLAAVLFTFSDFTDANDRSLSFTDIFAIKLYLAVPLTGF